MTESQRKPRVVAPFEFWPLWLVYAPVVLYSLVLAIRHRSMTVPLCANPGIPLAGMAGASKHEILCRAGAATRAYIAPWVRVRNHTKRTPEGLAQLALRQARDAGIDFPLVAKPDIGCRGAGVRLLRDADELVTYLADFPHGADAILQQFVDWQGEAGLFFIRDPAAGPGRLYSITLKSAPTLIGDGVRSVRELMQQDARVSRLAKLYTQRHQQRLDDVLAGGEELPLVFAGSHCQGSVFRDGREHITPALTKALEGIFADLDGIYYSRVDVRYKDLQSLRAGRDFRIIEINGAASEAAHIWDSRSTLRELYRTLFFQYRTLFRLGAAERRRGAVVPSLRALFHAWRRERRLTRLYPEAM